MANIGNKPLKDVFQQLLQISSSGEIADVTGSSIGFSVARDSDTFTATNISASGNVLVEGTLTAKEYIVSSSVTNVTFQQQSGSTIFGDSSDDTHQFFGNMSASGNLTIGHTDYMKYSGSLTLASNIGTRLFLEDTNLDFTQNGRVWYLMNRSGSFSISEGGRNTTTKGTTGSTRIFTISASGGNENPASYVTIGSSSWDGAQRGNLEIWGDYSELGAGTGHLALISNVSSSVSSSGQGGQLVFGGSIKSTDNDRTFGLIAGEKENDTDGNRAGYLMFGTREHGGVGGGELYERMRIDSTGKIGIGIATPDAILHISGSGDNDSYGQRILLRTTSGNKVSRSLIQAGTDEAHIQMGSYPSNSELTTVGMSLANRSTLASTSQTMSIDNKNDSGNIYIIPGNTTASITAFSASGNVGIGTMNPTDTLTLQGTSADFSIRRADGSLAARIPSFTSGAAHVRLYDSESIQTVQLAGDSASVSYINNGQNVGIGTSNPQQLLELSASQPTIRLQGDGNAWDVIVDSSVVTGESDLRFDSLNNTQGFGFKSKDGSGTDSWVVFDKDGQVGMGNTAPTKALTVKGDISASGDIWVQKGLRVKSSGDTISEMEILRISGSDIYQAHITHMTPLGPSFGSLGMIVFDTKNEGLQATGITHQKFVKIQPTITQADGAGYTLLEIDTNISSEGTGSKYLIDAKRGGTRKFTVDSTGHITASGNISGSATSTGSFGVGHLDRLGVGNKLVATYPLVVEGDTQIANGDIRLSNGAEIKFSGAGGFEANSSTDNGWVEIGGHTSFNVIRLGKVGYKTHVTASGNISASGTGSFGMVGIGAGNPREQLEIFRGAVSDKAFIYLSGTSNAGIKTDGPMTLDIDSNDNSTDTYLRITKDNTANDLMKVYEDGNVDIITGSLNLIGETGGHITASGNISASLESTASFGRVHIRTNSPTDYKPKTALFIEETGPHYVTGPILELYRNVDGTGTDNGSDDVCGMIQFVGNRFGADRFSYGEIYTIPAAANIGRGEMCFKVGYSGGVKNTILKMDGAGTTTLSGSLYLNQRNAEGHITASGNISASGTSHTFGGNYNGETTLQVSNTYEGAGALAQLKLTSAIGDGLIRVTDDAYNGVTDWQQSMVIQADTPLDGGLVLYSSDKIRFQNTIATDAVTILGGHITASGNISSSGTGSFGNLEVSGAIGDTLFNGYQIKMNRADANYIKATDDDGYLILESGGGNTLKLTADNTSLFYGHITASGNISASGHISASGFTGDGTTLNVPDYVFEPQYILKTLPEVEKHISEHKHLPSVPSREDKSGWSQLSVGDRDMKLLEKVEELTLYIIDLQKQIDELKKDRG